ncbi:MAG: hypothetical protein ABI837_20370, partial [Acidobacteriota bacterium]
MRTFAVCLLLLVAIRAHAQGWSEGTELAPGVIAGPQRDIPIPVYTAGTPDTTIRGMGADGTGRAVALWTHKSGGFTTLYASRLDGKGNVLLTTPVPGISPDWSTARFFPTADGGFLALWVDNIAERYLVKYSFIDSSLQVRGTTVTLASEDSYIPSTEADCDKAGCLALWSVRNSPAVYGAHIGFGGEVEAKGKVRDGKFFFTSVRRGAAGALVILLDTDSYAPWTAIVHDDLSVSPLPSTMGSLSATSRRADGFLVVHLTNDGTGLAASVLDWSGRLIASRPIQKLALDPDFYPLWLEITASGSERLVVIGTYESCSGSCGSHLDGARIREDLTP